MPDARIRHGPRTRPEASLPPKSRRRLPVAALIVLCAVPVCVGQAFQEPLAFATRTTTPSCEAGHVRITESPGVPGMGRFSDLILVSNTGGRACELRGYPTIGLLNSSGAQVATAAQNRAASGGPTNRSPVRLAVGETASAQLWGTDVPPGTATSCSSYAAYAVSLPQSAGSKVFEEPLADCSGPFVSSFVAGFNGFSPSGEIAGTARACLRAAPAGAPGPVVLVQARSGRRLVGSIMVVAGVHSTEPYRLSLAPGRYRISSTDSPSRDVVVGAGRVHDLGLYGGCSFLRTTTSTVPGHARGVTATTTVSG